MDLSRGGSIVKTFTNVTGTDLTAFNPNTRNFYTGSGSNNIASTGCPTDSSKNFPLIGIFNAPASGQANLVGVQCTGRSAKGPGVDPIDNFVYVGTRQYPVAANDATTGQNGVLVYFDPSPRLDSNPGTRVTFTSAGSKNSLGTIQFTTAQKRGLRGTGNLQSMPAGTEALIVVPTSIGNETLACNLATNGTAFCDGPLLGAPLIGAPALIGVDGTPVGRGVIQ